MIITGNWLPQVDRPEDAAYFLELYDMTYLDYILDYEIDYITTADNKNISHIVFLEYDGSFNQIFSLEDGDTVHIHTEGDGAGYMTDEVRFFNTDCMAFMQINSYGKDIGTYCVQDSPYDFINNEDWDLEQDYDTILNLLRQTLVSHNILIPVTASNTLLVRQL